MTTGTALVIVRDLRPQLYGATTPSRIVNPVVEPMWAGLRVLAAIAGASSLIHDETGEPVVDHPTIESSLRSAVAAQDAILDGFLTKQVSHDGTGAYVGTDPVPSTGAFMTQSMIGTRRNRHAEAAERLEHEHAAQTFGPSDTVTFVAIDLLHLDGDPLIEVPLLERKRLLEAVVSESDLVRRGAYVRPPIDTWVNSWRALGFSGLSYKAANGRYRPGGVKDDWAMSPMPRR